MAKIGIQYLTSMDLQAVKDSRLSGTIEIRVSEARESILELQKEGMSVSGAVWNPYSDGVLDAELISLLCEAGCEYVVVETKGLSDEEALREYLDKAIGELQARGLVLLIENSNIYQNGRYEYGAFSEGTKLCAIVSDLTEAYHYDGIGICADMGTANLLNCNVASFVEDCLAYLTLLHFNDNDGYHDDAQMPFTFTVGRGTRSTDIYRIIGVLVKCGFDGYIVANTSGTWGRTPRALHGSMLRLLDTMLSEYKHALSIKELLVRPGKRLILFGAGRMLYDYLINLGDECPPEFVVDNNDEIWNTTLLGCKVKPPKAILDVPAEERNVFICNSHYDAIGAQLREMGVEYDCFVDQYYL